MWALDFICKRKMKLLAVSLLLLSCMGFRVFPGTARWNVTPSTPKVWIQYCSRPTMTNNDLPSGDPLYGQSVTFDSVSQSIMDDYNNITSSFVKLYDAATDPAFSTSNTTDLIIYVCFTQAPFGEAGNSGQTVRNNQVVRCDINLDNSVGSSAKSFVRTVTHELGHCMGLDHPQDTTHAAMSYFTHSIRLQTDDKMGISYLYPMNSQNVTESPTFGLSCSPR